MTVAGEPVDGVGLTPVGGAATRWCSTCSVRRTSSGTSPPAATRTPSAPACTWLVEAAAARDWREAFPGFVRMEAMGDFFAYAAEDAFLARTR